jgi:hypothetical protein
MCEMAAPLGEIYGGLSMIADADPTRMDCVLDIGNSGLFGKVRGRLSRANFRDGNERIWSFRITTNNGHIVLGTIDILESSVYGVEIARTDEGAIIEAKICVFTKN